jgi:hypothetical protein
MSGRVGSITTDIIADGLVFNMDPANRASYPRSGTIAINTINSVTGTLNGPTFVSTTGSGVFNFDGNDDYIDAGSASYLNGLSNLSFFSWVNISTLTNDDVIASDWSYSGTTSLNKGHYTISQGPNDGSATKIRIYLKNSGADEGDNVVNTNSFILNSNQWYYIGFTLNNGTLFIYVNGVSYPFTVSYGSIPSSVPNEESNLNVGRWQNVGRYLNGDISPIHIYNRTLSANEVLHNFNVLKDRMGYVAPLLLDTYTGAIAAYSLRRLSNSYTGNLIRVTKKVSHVISETDIGYNSSNELDTAALATFANGADNGEVKVVTWYDQSGNGNNVSQSAWGSCPYIYQSGNLLTSNGKPGIVTGVQTLQTNNQPLSSLQQSGFFVGEPLGLGNYKTIFTHGDYYVFHQSTTTQVVVGKVSITKYSTPGGNFGVGTQSLLSYYNDSTDIYMRQDGSTIGTIAATPVSYTAKDINFGDYNNVNRAFYGYNQEHIIFPSEQSSNMSGIETNINNYYTIY